MDFSIRNIEDCDYREVVYTQKRVESMFNDEFEAMDIDEVSGKPKFIWMKNKVIGVLQYDMAFGDTPLIALPRHP